MSKKSGSSKRWLMDHARDRYVQAAKTKGMRSRAGYKLLQIQEKYGLMQNGHVIVDLGAAPGGFSQIARKAVGCAGRVIAVDLREMTPLSGVEIIKGDFGENSTLDNLIKLMDGQLIDLVISDMAPNFTGIKDIDQANSVYLVELVLEAVVKILRPGGSLIVKCFEGSGINELRSRVRGQFRRSFNFKPNASKSRSREVYLIGRNFFG